MKKLRHLGLTTIVFAFIHIASGQAPEVHSFSKTVSGIITGQVEAVVLDVGPYYKILDVVAGSAVATSPKQFIILGRRKKD